MKQFFVYFPYAVAAFTLLVLVVPARVRFRTLLVWSVFLLAAASKFLCFDVFGGDAFVPDFREPAIWVWNFVHSGMMILAALTVAWRIFEIVLWLAARRRLPRLLPLLLLPVAAWALAARGVWNGIRPPEVREIAVACAELPASLEGYRILQLTDLHVSPAAGRWRTEAIVESANAAGADLIVCTGDVVDGLPDGFGDAVAPLARLKARDGVWFVTGNHETYYCYESHWKKWYEERGIRFLRDKCVFPRRDLALAGASERLASMNRRGGSDRIGAIYAAATNGEFRVLLEHRPAWARENSKLGGVNLQLSGHTHGGVMPVLDRLVARHNRGFVRGLYPLAHGWLYCSPGTGQWAGFPLRFFNPPELTLLRLTAAPRR